MIVTSEAELGEWRLDVRRKLFPSAVAPIRFDFPGLLPDQNRHLTLAVARLRQACGCTAGGVAMIAAIFAITLTIYRGDIAVSDIPWLSWFGYIAFILILSVAGKLAGLMWAHWKLIRLVDTINPSSPHGWRCC